MREIAKFKHVLLQNHPQILKYTDKHILICIHSILEQKIANFFVNLNVEI